MPPKCVVADEPAVEKAPFTESITPTRLNEGETALDRYIAAKDDSYEWKIVSKVEGPAETTYVIDLTSQTWAAPGRGQP